MAARVADAVAAVAVAVAAAAAVVVAAVVVAAVVVADGLIGPADPEYADSTAPAQWPTCTR